MALTKYTGATNTIRLLSDRPNQTENLTAADIKAKFDQAAIETKDYIDNTLTPELDASLAAKTQALETHKDSADHDERYYTKTEADIQNSDLNDSITAVEQSLDAHRTGTDHDYKYYTKAQADILHQNLDMKILSNDDDISALQSRTTNSENNIAGLGASKADNSRVLTAENRITAVETGKVDKTTYDAQIINAGSSNSEVVDARGTYPKMKNRLDTIDGQLADIPNYIKVGTDETKIRAAAQALYASGGGQVMLPPKTIILTSPLPLLPGVKYVGIEPELIPIVTVVPGYMGDMTWNYGKGTVLIGDGTFSAMQGSHIDLADVPSELGLTQIAGCGAINIGFDNFTYAIKAGASNTIGVMYSEFRNLYAKNCSQWGFFFANFQHTKFDRLYNCRCQNSQYYGTLLPLSVFAPGNTAIGALYAYLPDNAVDKRLCRGIVFEAGGLNGNLNEIKVDRIQVNAMQRTKLTDTVTLTSGVVDLVVADGTKYLTGVPIVFTSTLAGFNVGQCYMVKSVTGNTIQLANDKTGSAIVPNASGALTLETYGFPNVEITRSSAGGAITNSRFNSVDVEGFATVALYTEGLQCCQIDLSAMPVTNQIGIVARTCSLTQYESFQTTTVDADAPSTTSFFYGFLKKYVQRELLGQWADNLHGNQNQFRLSTLSANGGGGDIQVRGSNKFLYPLTPMGEHVYTRTVAITLAEYQVGNILFDEQVNTTRTWLLPIVNDTSQDVSNIGAWYEIYNVGTQPLILNTQNSQVFNNISGKTSITIPPQNILKVVASKTSSGALIWMAEMRTTGIS